MRTTTLSYTKFLVRPRVMARLSVVFAATVASAASAVPSVLPGWPVPGPAARLFSGPASTVVALYDSFYGIAFGPSGSVVWAAGREPRCGNCTDGPYVEAQQLDGSYGPIGPEENDSWAFSSSGDEVASCLGAVLPDGTCIAAANRFGSAATVTFVVSVVRNGTTLWTVDDGASHPFSEVLNFGSFWRRVVAGNEGDVFYSIALTSGTPHDSQLVRRDATTGALLWQRDIPDTDVVAVAARPGGGVLVEKTLDTLVAYDRDGTRLWERPRASLNFGVGKDGAVGQVYVDAPTSGGDALPQLVALDSVTGAPRWRGSSGAGAGFLSVGRSGTIYEGAPAGRAFSLVAHAPDGTVKWRYPSASPAAGAAELTDGTVALASGGLIIRIAPRTVAPVVRRASVSLSRSGFKPYCEDRACLSDHAYGTIVRLELPRSAVVDVRFRVGNPQGKSRRVVLEHRRLIAPAGRSFVLFARSASPIPRGSTRSASVQVTVEGTHYKSWTLPVRLR